PIARTVGCRCAEAHGDSRHSSRLCRRCRIQGRACRQSVRRAVSHGARTDRRQRHHRRRSQCFGEARAMSVTSGTLIGVGVGPGDPELMQVKATRALREADVIAYFAKAGNPSHSRATIERYLRAGIIELPLAYPVTTELPKCSAGYREALESFYARAAGDI